MAISDKEHTVIYGVKVLTKKFGGRAIIFINYTTVVGMDVLVVCGNTEGNWLVCKVSLDQSYEAICRKIQLIMSLIYIACNFDVGGLGGRVLAGGLGSILRVVIVRGVRVFALKHGIVVFEVLEGPSHVATLATIIVMTKNAMFLTITVYELLLRERQELSSGL